MSTPPHNADRKRVPAAQHDGSSVTDPKLPLSQRLPTMTDSQLYAHQASAHRISLDVRHPKNATALKAIPKIEAEIGRRAAGLAAAKTQPEKARA